MRKHVRTRAHTRVADSWAFLIKTAKTPRLGKISQKGKFFLAEKGKNSPIGIYVFQKIESRKKRRISATSNLVEWIPRKKTRDFTEEKNFLPSILRNVRNFHF